MRKVSISARFYRAIERRILSTEFCSASEHVAFAMEEIMRDADGEETPFDAGDEEEVKNRLRGLGCLDQDSNRFPLKKAGTGECATATMGKREGGGLMLRLDDSSREEPSFLVLPEEPARRKGS